VDGDYYDDIILISSLSLKTLLDNDKKRQEIYDAIQPSEPKKKKYKVITKVDFKPNFKKDDSKLKDDAVNEYYYNQIKEALKQAVEMPEEENDVVEKKELDLSFAKFVRTLGQINFEMYEDIIKKHSYKLTKREGDQPKSKAFAIKEQEKIYKRYLLLSNLKSAELEKALRAESREFLKLEKLKAEQDIDFDEEIIEIPQEEEQQKPEEKIKILKKREAQTQIAQKKIDAAKAKSEVVLKKKITAARKKTRDLKAELYLKDQQRLIDISEENKLRKIELQKRNSVKN